MDYAYKFSDVSLALPYDGLTLKRAEQLSGLAGLIEDARDIRLKVYLVAPDSKRNNLFYVRECKVASVIKSFMSVGSSLGLGFDFVHKLQ